MREHYHAPFRSQIFALMQCALGTHKQRWVFSVVFKREWGESNLANSIADGERRSVCMCTWARMHACLCCAASQVGQKVVVLRWVSWDERADCSWMPLQRITSSRVTHFSFKMCHHGHLPSWGLLWIQSCLEGITGQRRSLSHSFIITAKVPNPYLTGKLIWEKDSFHAFGALGLQV